MITGKYSIYSKRFDIDFYNFDKNLKKLDHGLDSFAIEVQHFEKSDWIIDYFCSGVMMKLIR